MKTIYEDPRITAYVLGEMSDRDRAKFEKEIHDSPELARAVEEMKESASLFGEALPLEAADLGLSYAQRESVQRAMNGEKKPARRWAWMPQPFSPGWSWAGATLVLCLGAWLWVFTDAMNPTAGSGGVADMTGLKSKREMPWSGIRLFEEAEDVPAPADNTMPEPSFDAQLALGESAAVPAPSVPQVQTAPVAPAEEIASSSDLMITSASGSASAVGGPAPSAKPVKRAANGVVAGLEKQLNRGDVSNKFNAPSPTAATATEKVKSSRDKNISEVSEGYSALASQSMAAVEQAPRLGDIPMIGGLFKDEAGKYDRDAESRYAYEAKDQRAEAGNEAYEAIRDNPFKRVLDVESGTSTFGADVDTASYSNVHRFLQDGQLPPKEAVRIEELLNYFPYNYPQGEGRAPFATSVEIASAPWAPKHRLVRVGIRAKEVDARERQPMNLVFLVDVSGSMSSENKLPLVQKSLRLLTKNLERRDRVAIVVYAGSTGLVLDSTPDKNRILEAIDRMQSGGSTNGAGGIRLAYQVARDHYIKNGINRVILCTDGDFNVGTTDRGELVSMIENKRQEGVFLNIYGFGMGNLKDATLEQLANKGNGTYGYIDSFAEARKVFSEQLSGTLVTVAKDVKFQIEFNPSQVAAWRQIGYENRQLARQDFNDDTKDAGEVGAGHTVTVLYEIVPAGGEVPVAPDVHRYLEENPKSQSASGGSNPKGGNKEMLFLKIRYKEPTADESKLLTFPVKDGGQVWERASGDFKFAASVASFGMLLRESPYKGSSTWAQALALARAGKGEDEHGHRAEYLRLVELAKDLSKRE